MAKQEEVLNIINQKEESINTTKKEVASLDNLFKNDVVRQKFEQVLKDNANQFIGSLLSLVKNDKMLMQCNPKDILSTAMQSAILKLPINKTLGYAYIIPFKNNKKGIVEPQLQIGYKGYVQLALRSGQYKNMNAIPVYDGELISYNRLTEELVFDFTKRKSDEVIGYAGYFELLNGFTKTVYWSKEKILEHAGKFSKSFQCQSDIWQNEFDAMACKTVLKSILTKYGVLSVEMQKAVTSDKDSTLNNEEEGNDTIILEEGEFEVKDDDNI